MTKAYCVSDAWYLRGTNGTDVSFGPSYGETVTVRESDLPGFYFVDGYEFDPLRNIARFAADGFILLSRSHRPAKLINRQ